MTHAAARANRTLSGWVTSSHEMSTSFHEYGHMLDDIANGFGGRVGLGSHVWEELEGAGLVGPRFAPRVTGLADNFADRYKAFQQSWAAAINRGGMSQYGMSNRNEFIAETVARVLSGGHIDPIVRRTYFRLRGPRIPGILEPLE